ncbi:MAG: hypothetical protein GZ094_04880 [Mariniphaga sp.]|nr:hypothetical protein [Mariniphaga sp.]
MKTIRWSGISILLVLIIELTSIVQLHAQAFAVKRWRDTYPQMNGSYPISFMAFKGGFIIPVPHFFVRTWPTHYYIELGAMPVTDSENLTGSIKTGFLRIVEKILERSQIQKRSEETTQIKTNNLKQRDIELKLFNSRSDYLPDVYGIADQFIRLYRSINNLGKQPNAGAIAQISRREADELVVRFIMVNLLQADHGKKLEAFSLIRSELTRQIGETDYTNRKVYHFNFYSESADNGYAFLTR